MISAASSEEVKGRRDRIRGKEKFMGLPAFDTLQIFEDLEIAGFDEPKAKSISAVVRNVHGSSDVATKADLQHLEERVDTKLDKLGEELRHEIGALRKDNELLRKDMDAKHESLRKDMDAKFAGVDAKFAGVDARLDKLTMQLTFRLGGVMVATLTVLSLLPKIFH